MEKDFDSWNKRKKNIHNRLLATYSRPREIWWCSLGLNVGSEEDGKNDMFERPVLILNKFNKETARVVPLTSKITDDRNHTTIIFGNYSSSAKLSQLKTISTKRLTRKIGKLDQNQTKKVIRSIIEQLTQNETTP